MVGGPFPFLQVRCGGLVVGMPFGLQLLGLGSSRYHLLGRHGNSLDDAIDGPSFKGNLVNNLDEGKVVDDIPGGNQLVGILGRNGALELLSLEEIGLDFVPEAQTVLETSGIFLVGISRLGKGLGALAVGPP